MPLTTNGCCHGCSSSLPATRLHSSDNTLSAEIHTYSVLAVLATEVTSTIGACAGGVAAVAALDFPLRLVVEL